MKTFKLLAISFFSLILASCAIGPLAYNETARTIGKGSHEISAGVDPLGYVVKYNYGITEKIDIGLQVETFSLGLKLKYAPVKNDIKGWSLGGALLAGSSIGGSYQGLDLSASYLYKKIEPYLNFRIINAEYNFNDWQEDGDSSIKFTNLLEDTYTYGQIFIGTRVKLNKKWALSFELSSFVYEEGVEFEAAWGSAALIFNFH